MNIEFLKFDATPGEKHLGIATVRYEKRFIFRFKVIPDNKGSYYIQPACYKVNDKYLPAFSLDSSFESDELRNFVLDGIKSVLSQKPQQNAFNAGIQQPQQTQQIPYPHSFSNQQTQQFQQPPQNYQQQPPTAKNQYREDDPILPF